MSEFGGSSDGGWTPPGGGQVPSGSDPSGSAIWSTGAPPPFVGHGAAPGPFPPGPPGRPPSSGGGLRTLLIAIGVLLLALVGIVAVGMVLIPSEDEMYGPTDDEQFEVPATVDVGAPPTVVNPPADVDESIAAIQELEQFIFTPGADPAEWEARFTDPTGLREKIEPFASTLCAVGVRTVVVAVRFLDEHHAEVDYVFVGPNIPEIGRTFVFTGRVTREPGGPWLAEPGGVEQVAGLATGYCLEQDVTPRDGLEDEQDEKGTNDSGTLVDPFDR